MINIELFVSQRYRFNLRFDFFFQKKIRDYFFNKISSECERFHWCWKKCPFLQQSDLLVFQMICLHTSDMRYFSTHIIQNSVKLRRSLPRWPLYSFRQLHVLVKLVVKYFASTLNYCRSTFSSLMNTFRRMNFAPRDSMLNHFMLFPPDEMDFDTHIFSVYCTQHCFQFHFQQFSICWAFTCYQPFDSNVSKKSKFITENSSGAKKK